jgi:hypothetical protein
MTPKKKAKELFLKFRQIPPFSPYTGIDDGEAKQCALIAVDEIINSNPHSNPLNTEVHSTMDFWQRVKIELEKI